MPLVKSSISLGRLFGMRGDNVVVVATLSAPGAKVGDLDVPFTWHSDAHRTEQPIGTAKTDRYGVARIPFAIPTSPADDNVYVTAVHTQPEIFVPEATVVATAKASRRVEIGTRT